MSERRAARACLPTSPSIERPHLVDELKGLIPIAGWGHRLGDPRAADAYARLQHLAVRLGFPEPPPIEDLAVTGTRTPADQWLEQCGLR